MGGLDARALLSGLRTLLGGMSCLAALGCTTVGIQSSELPEQPIAVTYWESSDARRRAEILADSEAEKKGPRREGVAHLQHLGALVGIEEAKSQKQLARFPGYLALVDPRTGKVERVRAAPAGSRPLAWSSDGRRLMFASKHTGERAHLFEYDLDLKEVRRLTDGSDSHLVGDYGPDDRIVYYAVAGTGAKMVPRFYASPARGERGRVIGEGIHTDSLAWSRQGNPLIFVHYQKGRSGKPPQPFLLAREASLKSAMKRLGPGRDPVITRDGLWVVYSAPVGDSWRLRRMRPDGSGRASIGRGVSEELQPAVSPDGRFVAYVSHKEGEPDDLFVRRFDGTGDRVLVGEGAVATPVW